MVRKMSDGTKLVTAFLLIYGFWMVEAFEPFLAGLFGYSNDPQLVIMTQLPLDKALLLRNIAGVIYLLAGFNILRLKNWARVIVVWFSCFIILENVIYTVIMIIISDIGLDGIIGGFPFLIAYCISILSNIAIPLLFWMFFTSPKTKEQFSCVSKTTEETKIEKIMRRIVENSQLIIIGFIVLVLLSLLFMPKHM